jgi:hypothetical protein
MKKITFIVMALFLSLAFYPVQSDAATSKKIEPSSVVVPKPAESAEAKALFSRLEQIEKMDKSNMKASEKKVLRKEVRSIKKQLDAMGGYIYISVGAAILIVLLIIILL